MRRILANRASAARSKERKKAIVELEEQVAELQQQRQAHEGGLHELRTSNATLGAGLWTGSCEVNPAASISALSHRETPRAPVQNVLCQRLRILG